jgi:pSer/pThr/pTyr-binding forkhead associated (FHA) protein
MANCSQNTGHFVSRQDGSTTTTRLSDRLLFIQPSVKMNPRIKMAEKEPVAKGISPDWLVRGVLTKVGDLFDRLTGRGWKPSSNLATSELTERLKALLDSEIREEIPGCKFVPNNIKLKMQWDKFSTDSEDGLKKLETELLAAAVDHINEKRYFTHGPLAIEAKSDYFTAGVRLLVSFDKFADEDREAAVHLSIPGAQATNIDESVPPHKKELTFRATYQLAGEDRSQTLVLKKGIRLSVGRTKENDLSINDASVSKIHASLTIDDGGNLIVADTGSTNGTFVNSERIAYGKAIFVGEAGRVKFGVIDVSFKKENIPLPTEQFLFSATSAPANDEDRDRRSDISEQSQPLIGPDSYTPAATQPSLPVDEPAPTEPALAITPSFDDGTGGKPTK